MMRAFLAAALLAAALSGPLAGPAAAQDPRLVELEYDPATVVRVEGRVNVQATIRFGEGEAIQNVAIGDSQTWQVTPSRSANLLFVKPLAERATTNLTVVTNTRVYLFDLVASNAHRNPLYIMSFTYPEQAVAEEAQLAQSDPAASANALEMAAASDDLAVLDPTRLNFDWLSQGDLHLLPERIYDNGDATFLAWAADTPMPAILVQDEDGTEGPVNFAVRGDTIVIDLVPDALILRSGDASARLVNNGSAAAGG